MAGSLMTYIRLASLKKIIEVDSVSFVKNLSHLGYYIL